jgi:DNA polymerase III subunit beta
VLTADHGQRLRLTCSRDELLSRLQIVGRAVSARSSVQILSGILFDAGDGERPPLLAATDMELSVRAPLDAEVAEGGRAVLPGRLLLDIVRRLPPGQVSIALAEGGGLATIEAGASEYRLHTYSADDYPELPEIDRERLFSVEREAFIEAIERVVHAASRDEARPVLTGVHVELGLGTLTVAATDSYRLAVRTTTLEGGPVEDIQAIVPARALGELVRIAQGASASSVEIVSERNQMLFGIDDVWLSARVIEGQFPNFRALRPDAFEHEVLLPRTELAEVLSRMELLAQRTSPLRMRFEPGELTVSAATQEVGEGRERLPCDFRGEPLEIGFNAAYLRDGVMAVGGDEVHLKLISSLRPGLLTAGGDDFWYLVMPIRLSG